MSGRFLCVDRNDAHLPEFFASRATAVIVAGPDLLHAFEFSIWLAYPLGWTMVSENRGALKTASLRSPSLVCIGSLEEDNLTPSL